VAGSITSIKNSTDTIENRTSDLPACSAVPQPTAPLRRLFSEQVPNSALRMVVAVFIEKPLPTQEITHHVAEDNNLDLSVTFVAKIKMC
jgi:hypothetical protein